MGPDLFSGVPFNLSDERAMPDRRVGRQRQFYAVYGSTSPTEFLLVTLQNARPRGRPPLGVCQSKRLLGNGALPGALRA